jgi:hypothetical protein
LLPLGISTTTNRMGGAMSALWGTGAKRTTGGGLGQK